MKGSIVVGQSGGPTAVINSSVAGVYAAAKKLGVKKYMEWCMAFRDFCRTICATWMNIWQTRQALSC